MEPVASLGDASAQPRARRRVVVTGGAVRLGRAFTRAFAAAGYDVLIHYHGSRAAAAALAEELQARGCDATTVRADLSQAVGCRDLVDAARRRWDRLDVLVNSAALYELAPVEALTVEQWDRMLAVNCRALFLVTQGLLEPLRAAELPGGALVLNIADIAGERPAPGQLHYAVSKAGVIQLTRALALELAPRLRVNAIAPGTVLAPEDMPAAQLTAIRETIPARRVGRPEDVADAAVFLAERAPYVTGQVWSIDGGRSVAGPMEVG